ncbi:MFS transporter [Paraburkholderia pallida]|uniref:MFS transporter n=1 Tax=Paraburkholderia pallida TaxID=2547399 RepID=A0A4P7DB30_9BURK|nr:MFS transporter [Paraburkholderia pallida]QBR03992.1 MFS transporter [Paraburkholderia pallida]
MHCTHTSAKFNLLARLDRLPVMATHYLWAALLAANLMLEYYDNAIFAYAIPTIKKHTNLSLEQIGFVTRAFFVGSIIGALMGGVLSDKRGRRSVLVWATVLYSLGALATAFAPGYETMLAARAITGIGVQAATSVLLVYVAEMFPRRARGRFASVVLMGYVVAGIGAAALTMFVLPHGSPNAWRHLLVAGSVGLLIAPVVRFVLPESVRWYAAKGQFDRAEAIVGDLEARALRKGSLDEPELAAVPGNAKEPTLRELLKHKAVRRTVAVLAISYFGTYLGYYLYATWSAYALINGLKYSEEQAYYVAFLWNVIYGVTPFLTMRLLDRSERKSTILVTSILSALSLVVLGISTNSWVVIGAGGFAAVITGMVINAYFTYIPETIPTQLRALGSGIVISGGRFGGAASGVLGAALFSRGSMEGVMLAAAACYIVFSIPVLLYGPRTTNRSLELVTSEELNSVEETRRSPSADRAAEDVRTS